MPAEKRYKLAAALTLIGIGGWFMAVELSAPIGAFAHGAHTWPLPIIGIAAWLLLLGLVTWTPGMFIPAVIVGGVGGLLFYQNTTGNWGSWAYAWALIPGFVGLGLMLTGAAARERDPLVVGGWMLIISLIAFAIFGSFLGGGSLIATFWPILLILLGVILLAQAFFRKR